jgi:hypothetical protein
MSDAGHCWSADQLRVDPLARSGTSFNAASTAQTMLPVIAFSGLRGAQRGGFSPTVSNT